MIDFISYIPNRYAEGFNDAFIDGSCDTPIEDFVVTAMKEFEAIDNIKIENVEIVYDQDEIDPNYHMININYTKKNLDSIEIPKRKPIYRSRYGEAIFRIRITTNKNEKVITKKILFPVEVDGYFYNNNKKMKAIWQLVEASTYGQRGKVTLKSRMPVIIYRNRHRMIDDIFGDHYSMPSFSYALNSKARKGGPGKKQKTKFFDPLMLYMAKMGWTNTRNFFGMDGIVDIIPLEDELPSEKEREKFYFFPLDFCMVRVDSYFYDKYEEVREFTCMCCNLHSKEYHLRYSNLEDKSYWVCRIGFVGSTKNPDITSFREKGKTTILMIERLLDQTTINNLRLPGVYKHNVYYLISWMISNFEELKAKRNMDMRSKRVRKNEMIVNASLGKKINENINKIVEKLGKSRMNTIDTLLEMFNFNSDIIMSGMRNMNDVIKTDDIVNDNSILLDLAWSSKGPNSMGENNSAKISDKYRYLDPSMVGIVDLSTTSNNDVGLSGAFVPYVKTYDRFYFTPDPEPAEGRYRFECGLANETRDDWQYESPYDLSTFAKYIESIEEHDPYRSMLEYEKICIVEKEDDADAPPSNRFRKIGAKVTLEDTSTTTEGEDEDDEN